MGQSRSHLASERAQLHAATSPQAAVCGAAAAVPAINGSKPSGCVQLPRNGGAASSSSSTCAQGVSEEVSKPVVAGPATDPRYSNCNSEEARVRRAHEQFIFEAASALSTEVDFHLLTSGTVRKELTPDDLRLKAKEEAEAHERWKLTAPYFPAFHKACVTVASSIGQRRVVSMAFLTTDLVSHYDVATYPKVKGHIALTIDDALCRQRGDGKCMAKEVGELLAKFRAEATFFLTTDFVIGHEDEMVELMVQGHDVANHCQQDRPYDSETDAVFERALLEAEAVCEDLRRRARVALERRRGGLPVEVRCPSRWAALASFCCGICPGSLGSVRPTSARSLSSAPPSAHARTAPELATAGSLQHGGGPSNHSAPELAAPEAPACTAKFFRPPAAKHSSTMTTVLKRHKFKFALGDCYANDPWISDPRFIASTMLHHAHDGSVMVIHMPERGFREYNFEALHKVLEGLQQRNMKVVTLSTLYGLANN